MKLTTVMIGLLFLSGCSFEKRNYAAKPVFKYYKEIITADIKSQLKDPYSAVFVFKDLTQKTCGVPVSNYWLVTVSVNAKNSFGGYTGAKDYKVYLTDTGIAGYNNCFQGSNFRSESRSAGAILTP